MQINTTKSQPIKISEETIETMNSFCYLGSVITTNGVSAEDIMNRFNKDRSAFYSLDKVWRSTHISRKIRLFNACIKSISFCYLGSVITTNGVSAEDIMNRFNKDRSAFYSLDKVWRSTHISRKIRLFNACIKSIVLYGCETWNAPARELNILQAFINRCLRIIIRVFCLNTTCNGLWNLLGSRRRGRPRTKVAADVADAGWNEIKTLAMNRSDWNGLVNALSSS